MFNILIRTRSYSISSILVKKSLIVGHLLGEDTMKTREIVTRILMGIMLISIDILLSGCGVHAKLAGYKLARRYSISIE